uniref:Uncharacterized protein n=1 Tax=Medicago truncatula TaxID=3880 RepID=I3T0S9_MEDTR|nr:unknown [Medicago truncatula]
MLVHTINTKESDRILELTQTLALTKLTSRLKTSMRNKATFDFFFCLGGICVLFLC